MDPAEAVELATARLVEEAGPEPPPRDMAEMMDYWSGPQGARDLGAELGRPYARRPRGPDPGASSTDPRWRAYHDWRSQAREIQRWRTGAGETRGLTKRRLGEVRRATARRWRRENPRPRRSQVLANLLRTGAIVEFSGTVQISNDEGYRHNTSVVKPSDRNLANYVAAALDRRWEEAAEQLAQAWNNGYGIPARISWVEVDQLEIE